MIKSLRLFAVRFLHGGTALLEGGDTVSTGMRRFVRRVGGSSDLVKTAGTLQLPTITLSSLSLPN